jgi:hypothetical protein
VRVNERAAGFSLVEVTIVLALAVPLLLLLGGASKAAIGSLTTTERSAKITEIELRAISEIEHVLRCGRLQTLQSIAVRADVTAGRAAAVGDWFPMPASEPRTELEVWSLIDGTGPPLVIPSRRHRLVFARDPAELQNGSDDDGDGLIDEGVLQVLVDNDTTVVLTGLEACTFMRTGNVIEITLRSARPGHGRALRRSTIFHTVVLSNP